MGAIEHSLCHIHTLFDQGDLAYVYRTEENLRD